MSETQKSEDSETAPPTVADVGTLPRATHRGVLPLGGSKIPCFVLENGKRVLSQRGLISALGISRGGGDRLAKLAYGNRLEPFVSADLKAATVEPLKFLTFEGSMAYSYEATVLADICDAVLDARRAGVLQKQQMRIADQCEILVRGFARVGIIALVDEVTGYQRDRTKDALTQILEKFISRELAKYASVFPDDFYMLLFKLRGWTISDVTKRPGYTAQLTNDIVYRRLAPKVLDELKRVQLRGATGRPKHKLYQRLTENHGYPRLKEHLAAVIALMRAAPNWPSFMRMLDRALPRQDIDDLFPGEGYGEEVLDG